MPGQRRPDHQVSGSVGMNIMAANCTRPGPPVHDPRRKRTSKDKHQWHQRADLHCPGEDYNSMDTLSLRAWSSIYSSELGLKSRLNDSSLEG